MNLHDNKLCKKKCDSIVSMLQEIQEILAYPRSDREQNIKCIVDIALQDVSYLSNEIEPKETE